MPAVSRVIGSSPVADGSILAIISQAQAHTDHQLYRLIAASQCVAGGKWPVESALSGAGEARHNTKRRKHIPTKKLVRICAKSQHTGIMW